MKNFLMCEPKFFEVRYVINPWMEGNLGKVDKALAQQQWENLHRILSDRATVTLIEPAAGLPDMVFTANAGLVRGRQNGERKVIVSSFRHHERQPETQHFENFFATAGYHVLHLKRGTIFEGAGDALFDAQERLWFASGIRSVSHARDEIIDAFHVDVHSLELVDPRWYHLDTAFCPLPEGRALAYSKAFSAKSVVALNAAFGKNIIWVSDLDAKHFACNAISIGKSVILHKASAEMKGALERRGLEVVEADVSEFLKAGGACKCLTLEI